MVTSNSNIGSAFPLENLESDIARNNYNYESILNGLIHWDNTSDDNVVIRLSTSVNPYYIDYIIPSKRFIDNKSKEAVINLSVLSGEFADISNTNAIINELLYGGSSEQLLDTSWIPDQYDLGDVVTFKVNVKNNGGTSWGIYYIPHVEEWTSGSDYRYGNYVSFPVPSDGNNIHYYIVEDNITNSVVNPVLDTTTFTDINPSDPSVPAPIAILNKNNGSNIVFSSSTIFTYTLLRDIDGFVFKNEGSIDSSLATDITVKINSKSHVIPSIYQKTVGVFGSSDYFNYPEQLDKFWRNTDLSTLPLGPTDGDLDIIHIQSYSARMVFNHSNQEVSKTVNFINYDGPDLDQGLCIYLIVDSSLGADGSAKPEDGFTFDFYFRIYPDVSLTKAITPDNIVNKAQIYVYNAPNNTSSGFTPTASPEVIAKFSMARMTNFYTFGENISIPDKPVIYRATFIYSAIQDKWITLDYYQLPDHIFMGPVGFIDPQNPGNVDLNNDTIGNINPNAKYIGYETSAFPTFVDPFSNVDLTPYKLDPSEKNDFYNRVAN